MNVPSVSQLVAEPHPFPQSFESFRGHPAELRQLTDGARQISAALVMREERHVQATLFDVERQRQDFLRIDHALRVPRLLTYVWMSGEYCSGGMSNVQATASRAVREPGGTRRK